MKQKSFWIAKSVFMRANYAVALGVTGDLLSAAATHKRISIGTIKGFRPPAGRALTPAARLRSAKQHDLCLFSLTHSLPEL